MAETHTNPAGLQPEHLPDELMPQGPPPAGWAPPPAGGPNAELPPPPLQAGPAPTAPHPQQQVQPGHPPQQGYAPAPPHGYAPQPGYAPQQGYAPAPQHGYTPQPGYAPQQPPQPARELSWDETDQFWEPVRAGESLHPVQSWDHVAPTNHYPMERPAPGGGGKVIAAGFCAAISILFLPIIFGPAGMVLGHMADKQGHRNGAMMKWLSLICMIVGFILGVLMYQASRNGV